MVVRGRQLELYVNSAAVCDPLVMDYDFTPAWLRLEAKPAPKAALEKPVPLAELAQISVWPAEAISPPEARGASAPD
jgi:hypothetical protein